MEYGRRPYPFGRNFGALSSVSPPVLGFLVFSFWTPYFLRGFFSEKFSIVSLLCGVAHPLGPRPFGLNFWGHPAGHPVGHPFWVFVRFCILLCLFAHNAG